MGEVELDITLIGKSLEAHVGRVHLSLLPLVLWRRTGVSHYTLVHRLVLCVHWLLPTVLVV